MPGKRRKFTSEFKARVALAAIKNQHTRSEIAQRFEVHPNQVSDWKGTATRRLSELFEDRRSRRKAAEEAELRDQLYQQIGQLKVELDWLKKKSGIER